MAPGAASSVTRGVVSDETRGEARGVRGWQTRQQWRQQTRQHAAWHLHAMPVDDGGRVKQRAQVLWAVAPMRLHADAAVCGIRLVQEDDGDPVLATPADLVEAGWRAEVVTDLLAGLLTAL